MEMMWKGSYKLTPILVWKKNYTITLLSRRSNKRLYFKRLSLTAVNKERDASYGSVMTIFSYAVKCGMRRVIPIDRCSNGAYCVGRLRHRKKVSRDWTACCDS